LERATSWTARSPRREAAQAKLAAVSAVFTDGRRLIWTDEIEVPRLGPPYDELTVGDGAMLAAAAPKSAPTSGRDRGVRRALRHV
jgi:hypothetical protein